MFPIYKLSILPLSYLPEQQFAMSVTVNTCLAGADRGARSGGGGNCPPALPQGGARGAKGAPFMVPEFIYFYKILI